MTNRRKVEIYSVGCSICNDVIQQVREAACSSCDIVIRDMMHPEVQRSAASLGIHSIPTVVIDGRIASRCCCCEGRSVNMEVLAQAGLGRSME